MQTGVVLLSAWMAASLWQAAAHSARPVTSLDLIELNDLGDMSERGLSVSPDGKFFSIPLLRANVAANRYRMTWYVGDTGHSATLVSLGDGGDPILNPGGEIWWVRGISSGVPGTPPAKWSPDSQWLAFLVRQHGSTQLWRARRDGTIREQLTHQPADVETFSWADDGRTLFFKTGLALAKAAELQSAEAVRGFLLDERMAPYYQNSPVWEREPSVQAELERLWAYDIASRRERLATEVERAASNVVRLPAHPKAASIVFSPRGDSVAWLQTHEAASDGAGPPSTLTASPLPDGSKAVACLSESCAGPIDTLWWDEKGEIIYFVRRYLGGESLGIYAWKPGQSTVRQVLRTDALLVGCAGIPGRAICLRESAASPRTVVSINLRNGQLRTLHEPNPDFHRLDVRPGKKLIWKNARGESRFGYLVLPRSYEPGRRYPLIITMYVAEGFLRGGTGDEYPVQVFAANGFAVLCFDESITVSRRNDADKISMQSSLDAAVNLLDGMGVIDPKRVGLTGLSYGAETTHYALFNMKHLAAAAASGPGWDPGAYYLLDEYFRKLVSDFIGSPTGSDATHWSNLSLALNAPKVKAPLLIQAADREYLLTLQAHAALKEAGKPVEVHVFPDEYHIKWQPQHRYNVYRRNVQWFLFWLRNMEVADPVDPDQYVRWRKLRALQHAAVASR